MDEFTKEREENDLLAEYLTDQNLSHIYVIIETIDKKMFKGIVRRVTKHQIEIEEPNYDYPQDTVNLIINKNAIISITYIKVQRY